MGDCDCPICLKPLPNAAQGPIVLTACFHEFCARCYEEYRSNYIELDPEVPLMCPLSSCRQLCEPLIDPSALADLNGPSSSSSSSYALTVVTDEPKPFRTVTDISAPIELERLDIVQRKAYDLIVTEGRCVFITGGAGTGKSELLKRIIHDLRVEKGYSALMVTAPTGIAAIPLNGCTVHSALKLGLHLDTMPIDEELFERFRKSFAYRTWRNVRVMVIDEISMLHPHIFNMLDCLLRRFPAAGGNSNLPFGGRIVVPVGDFGQLPPVGSFNPTFVFETPLFRRMIETGYMVPVQLRVQHRQNGDSSFASILSRVRLGQWTKEDSAVLYECHLRSRYLECFDLSRTRPHQLEPDQEPPLRATILTCRRDDADVINTAELKKLPTGPSVRYLAQPSTVPCVKVPKELEEPDEDDPFETLKPKEVRDKEKLKRLADRKEYVQRRSQELLASLERTEHRHQIEEEKQRLLRQVRPGLELHLRIGAQVMLVCNLDVRNGLCNGTRGVVVGFEGDSSSTTPSSAPPLSSAPERIEGSAAPANSSILAIMDEIIAEASKPQPMPIVQFINGTRMPIMPHTWSTHYSRLPEIRISWCQTPLILAWAITVHKSQGLTIDCLSFDPRDVFVPGQFYTALSRSRSLDGLALSSWADRPTHLASSLVIDFYRRLDEEWPPSRSIPTLEEAIQKLRPGNDDSSKKRNRAAIAAPNTQSLDGWLQRNKK